MRKCDGAEVIFLRRDRLKERGAGTYKGDQPGVAVRSYHPKKIDPVVEAFRQGSEYFASGDEQVKRSRTAAFQKARRAPHQP